jgi:hypothetical protein
MQMRLLQLFLFSTLLFIFINHLNHDQNSIQVRSQLPPVALGGALNPFVLAVSSMLAHPIGFLFAESIRTHVPDNEPCRLHWHAHHNCAL